MLRAIIEGLDYQFLDIVKTMQTDLNVPFDKLVVAGGAVRNKFWMQNKADMVGQVIEVSAVEDATPMGAALLGGIGVGIYRDEQDAFEHVWRPGVTLEPDPKVTARYAELFPIYRQLYAALSPISHQLYDRFLG
jgi:xylulokinase